MRSINRRTFLKGTALTGAAALGSAALRDPLFGRDAAPAVAKPFIICSGNGSKAIEKAMEMIHQGSDALDAVIAGVNIVEDDPNDTSVGYGGLPNEEGVVELDAAVLHGPTHRGGAVAAIRNIKNPSKVARTVLERTNHVLLVGEGALKFAKAHGFQEENLLTDKAREAWLEWKENLSTKDDWLPAHSVDDREIGALYEANERHYGTIHCSAIDQKGNISSVTTTSGLAFKIPGRVGDSAIIGAGLFCDNEVGAAGSTGRGEANLMNLSSAMIVEWMRQGKTPDEACLLACKRINDHTHEKRFQDAEGRVNYDVKFFAINKKGAHGGCSIWSGGEYLIHDGTAARRVEFPYLFKKK
jgi:N4-(beta-N-acetylglucosaminyl)-L-asparaginase